MGQAVFEHEPAGAAVLADKPHPRHVVNSVNGCHLQHQMSVHSVSFAKIKGSQVEVISNKETKATVVLYGSVKLYRSFWRF